MAAVHSARQASWPTGGPRGHYRLQMDGSVSTRHAPRRRDRRWQPIDRRPDLVRSTTAHPTLRPAPEALPQIASALRILWTEPRHNWSLLLPLYVPGLVRHDTRR